MAQFPALDEAGLPGRLVFRSGVKSQVAGAALLLGEGVIITDKWWGCLGDTSQNPPVWPTSKSTGNFDWTNINPIFDNIDVNTINHKSIKDLILDYITKGDAPVITIINEHLTKTVYGVNPDFADLEAAYNWLSQRTISDTGLVTLVFPVGKIVETKYIIIKHPNGDKINWVGADLKRPLPPASSFQVSGYSPAAQALDAQSNLALLRQCYNTEFYFTKGGGILFASKSGQLSNVLLNSDGDTYGRSLVHGIEVSYGGSAVFKDVAITNFEYNGLNIISGSRVDLVSGSSLICFNNGASGVGVGVNSLFSFTYANVISIGNGGRHAADFTSPGLGIGDNSLTASYTAYNNSTPTVLYSCGNTGSGISIGTATLSGTFALTVKNNGSGGIVIGANGVLRNTGGGGTISDNHGSGLIVDSLSLAYISNYVVTNNSDVGLAAYNNSFIFRPGCTVNNNGVDYSPALGVEGNTNSQIA